MAETRDATVEDPLLKHLFQVQDKRLISNASIARSLSVSRNVVGEWRRGIKTPSYKHLQAMLDLLGMRLILEEGFDA